MAQSNFSPEKHQESELKIARSQNLLESLLLIYWVDALNTDMLDVQLLVLIVDWSFGPEYRIPYD